MDDLTIEDLLQVYSDLSAKQKMLKSNGVNDYHLITSLLKKSDEVRVHSRFLKSMLNPSGLHYQDDAFLKLFFKLFIPEKNRPNPSQCNVYAEKDKIDLLIEDGRQFIIIENKIYAADQPLQIARYVDHVLAKGAKPENIIVIYLSLNGKNPSSLSLNGKNLSSENASTSEDAQSYGGFKIENGFLKWVGKAKIDLEYAEKLSEEPGIPLINLSYHKDIMRWIDACIIKLTSKDYPQRDNTENILFAFKEYKSVLKMLNPKEEWKKMPSLYDEIKFNKEMSTAFLKFSQDVNATLGEFLYNFFLEIERVSIAENLVKTKLNTKKFNNEHFDTYSSGACKDFFIKDKRVNHFGVYFELQNGKATPYLLTVVLGIKRIHFGILKRDVNGQVIRIDENEISIEGMEINKWRGKLNLYSKAYRLEQEPDILINAEAELRPLIDHYKKLVENPQPGIKT